MYYYCDTRKTRFTIEERSAGQATSVKGCCERRSRGVVGTESEGRVEPFQKKVQLRCASSCVKSLMQKGTSDQWGRTNWMSLVAQSVTQPKRGAEKRSSECARSQSTSESQVSQRKQDMANVQVGCRICDDFDN